ncbi:MAG: hypothetical protein WAV73_03560 [Candidatus Moraniibacteriota bacterium]
MVLCIGVFFYYYDVYNYDYNIYTGNDYDDDQQKTPPPATQHILGKHVKNTTQYEINEMLY